MDFHNIIITASSILVPVKWSDDFLPFRVVSKSFQPPRSVFLIILHRIIRVLLIKVKSIKVLFFSLYSSSHIEIVMEKKPRVPVLVMKVGNFGSLPTLFNCGVMHAVVRGKEVASYSFEHKSECR